MITEIAAASIGATGIVAAAWITSGRHLKAIRHQLTPNTGKTLAAELAEHRHELAALAIAQGLHQRDDVRHRGPFTERKLP